MSHLKELVLENFKCFHTRTTIPLAPLTLLFGANSAGKSSIIQALQILKYCGNMSRFPPEFPPYPTVTYRDLVYGRNEEEGIRIGLAMGKPTSTMISWNQRGEMDPASRNASSAIHSFLNNGYIDSLGPIRDISLLASLVTGDASNTQVIQTINDDLLSLGIMQTCKGEVLGGGSLAMSVLQPMEGSQSLVSLDPAMVGFGINQLLPVIALCRHNEDQIISLQEPESHLHPLLQTEIGSFLVDVVNKQRNQLIVETHSEHILLRVQRQVRRGTISPDDLSLIYVEACTYGSSARRILLNRSGDLSEWPTAFMADRSDEIYGN